MEKGQAIGHISDTVSAIAKGESAQHSDFVLERSIFNNVFEKDIRRIFIYKKAERLAKAIHLVTPAFVEAPSLRDRIDAVAMGLVDAAILPSHTARVQLSRELLALSSILSIARSGGLLSVMNADLIARETHVLLKEVAEYEEPRLAFDDVQTLAEIAKKSSTHLAQTPRVAPTRVGPTGATSNRAGGIKDTLVKDRVEAIMSVIRSKKVASIKDISTIIRDVSEKTVQRELIALVASGVIRKQGERRWSTYSIPI